VAKFEWCVLKECVRECAPNISQHNANQQHDFLS